MKYLILILMALGLAATATAEKPAYYVWVDENGVTNYSERHPRGYDATYIGPNQGAEEAERRPGQRPGAVEEGPAAEEEEQPSEPATAGQQNDVDPDELIADERAKIAAQIAETKRQNCEIGKRNLTKLTAYARIRVEAEDGSQRVLSEEERQAQIEEARQIVRDNCTG